MPEVSLSDFEKMLKGKGDNMKSESVAVHTSGIHRERFDEFMDRVGEEAKKSEKRLNRVNKLRENIIIKDNIITLPMSDVRVIEGPVEEEKKPTPKSKYTISFTEFSNGFN